MALATPKVDPDMPLSADGTTFHVPARAADLADRIILVGDPARVEVVSTYFDQDSITYRGSHREINLITGAYKGVRVSVLSTGMGTDNVEIVLNEVHILKEYDVERAAWRTRAGDACGAKCGVFDPSGVKLIRVGTCGSPQESVQLGCLAITRYCVGMDNTCQYYKPPAVSLSEDVKTVLRTVQEKTTVGQNVQLYATKATPAITAGLVKACEAFNHAHPDAEPQAYYVGTTCSASGFYGCQGRAVGRLAGSVLAPSLTEELSTLSFEVSEGVETVANIEMENSALCFLSNVLGYQAGTVCAVLAKRSKEGRAVCSEEKLKTALSNAITIALDAVTTL